MPEPKLEEPSGSLDLEQIWYVLREKAWLILLCGLLGIFAGLAYIHRTPLTYMATSVLEVDPEPIKVVGYEDGQEAKDPISEEMGQTVLAQFHTRQFAQEVIEENGLLQNPSFLPPLPDGAPHTMDEAINQLLSMEAVTQPPGTRFISVGVIHYDPVMARDLADMLAKHYLDRAKAEQHQNAQTEITYLQQQAEESSTNLEASEVALNDYAKTHSASLVDSHDTVLSELKSKSGDLSLSRAELLRLEADDEEAQKEKDNQDALLAIPSVANDPSIMEYQQLINQLRGKIEVLKLRWTEKHPGMILARTQLSDAEANLKKNVMNIPALIHAKREAAEERVSKFGSAVDDQEKAAMQLDDDHIKYEVLQRKVQANQALYDGILTKLRESKVATGMDSTGINMFEGAQIPMDPRQQRKSKTLCVSLIGGLVMGVLLSFGLHMLDSSVKSVDQAEDVLGLTVLAAIPRQGQSRLKESSLALIKAPGSPVAEAFRSLRTSLYLAGKSKGRKIILFTSTLAGEGKTFCSTNYATALAQQGLRTLLIDADLRSPMIQTVLMGDRKLPGLAELLCKKVTAEEAIHTCEIENLWVMPAGDLLPNPAEMLARGDMGDIIKDLGEKFERIVIDTAPVTAVSDTLLLLEYVQAICLVARAGGTPRKWILRALKLIAEAGSRPTGVILNQMPMRMAGAYSYYPGKYGQPEVYGNNTIRNGKPKKGEPELADSKARF